MMYRMPAINRDSRGQWIEGRCYIPKPPARSAYLPATPESVHSVTFEWSRACDIYTIEGSSVRHKGGGELPYRPVMGNLAMQPNTGKYFFSYRVNTDNCRIGFCTDSVYATDNELRDLEFGRATILNRETRRSLQEQDAQQPSFLQTIGALPGPRGRRWEAYIDLQSSKVFINGVETRKFWRLFVPTCGGVVSFVVDTDLGAVQLFMDGKYAGMMVDEQSEMRGNTVYPCVGISGYDMANRSIAKGYMGAFVDPPHPFDCLY